jgi:hypothetical protein
MKRYRWTSFYVDTERALYRHPAFPNGFVMDRERLQAEIAFKYGELNVDKKSDRWLSLDVPSLCAPGEYLDLLHEIEHSYTVGAFYPALTGACCLGERILNHLILLCRKHKTSHPRYKEVWDKESIDDWTKALSILKAWALLPKSDDVSFRKLLRLRNPAVHFGPVEERESRAFEALQLAFSITSSLFGQENERFMWCSGEVYIKKEYEADPVTVEFVLPHCHLLGYAHVIESSVVDGQMSNVLREPVYETTDISDSEFQARRERFLASSN